MAVSAFWHGFCRIFIIIFYFSILLNMVQPDLQNLKYGIIYLFSDRSFSPGVHDPEALVKKFVYPMQVEWIDEPGRADLFMIARRFNVGNIGRYATVSLSLSRMNRSGGWFEAIRHFADALMGVSDDGDGDIVINEEDYGHHYYDQSSVFGEAKSAAPQDNTRMEPSRMAGRLKRFQDRLHDLLEERHEDILESPSIERPDYELERPERDLLQEKESDEVLELERERKQALERIKRDIINYIAHYHEDP